MKGYAYAVTVSVISQHKQLMVPCLEVIATSVNRAFISVVVIIKYREVMRKVRCCCVAVVKVPVKSDMLNAVVSHSGFEQLKAEVERCHATLAQLDSAVPSALKQVFQQTSQVYVMSCRYLSIWNTLLTTF